MIMALTRIYDDYDELLQSREYTMFIMNCCIHKITMINDELWQSRKYKADYDELLYS